MARKSGKACRSPHTPEEIARAATLRLEAAGPTGAKVKFPLNVVLDRERAERLSARAIREGKNLDALVAEILETAVG